MRARFWHSKLSWRDVLFATAGLILCGLLLAPTLPTSVTVANEEPSGAVIAQANFPQDTSSSQEHAGTQRSQEQDNIGGIIAPEINPDDGASLIWLDDYQNAREIARAAKKPLFVVIRCER